MGILAAVLWSALTCPDPSASRTTAHLAPEVVAHAVGDERAPLSCGPAQESVSRPAAEEIDFKTLVSALKGNELEQQWNTMEQFAKQASAPAAIEGLLEEMQKNAPYLDNNVGLTVELILFHHPDAPCPMEPLLEAIRRHVWNSQQKCAQALLPLLERGDGKERVKELSVTLIPLLASQRPRVFSAGRRCLEALTGERLGDTPDPWLAWYEQRFGEAVDMQDAVYEDLIIIRPRDEGAGDAAPLRFTVEGEELESIEELRALVEVRAAQVRERALSLGVVIQVANERLASNADMDQVFAARDVTAVFSMLAEGVGNHDLVVSPMSDGFRSPWRPAASKEQPR